MPNPLQTQASGPPDAPQGGIPQTMMQGPQMPMAPQGAPPAPPQAPQMPAPTHAQTVAALRHFHAIAGELQTLLRDPDLGRADMKGKIIDGTTQLVAQRIITPAQAVVQLGDVPEKPFDQKQWIMTHFQQTKAAADAVLGHHAQAFAGQEETGEPPAPEDDHFKIMSGLHEMYRGIGRG